MILHIFQSQSGKANDDSHLLRQTAEIAGGRCPAPYRSAARTGSPAEDARHRGVVPEFDKGRFRPHERDRERILTSLWYRDYRVSQKAPWSALVQKPCRHT